jgi:hypothetical protein
MKKLYTKFKYYSDIISYLLSQKKFKETKNMY